MTTDFKLRMITWNVGDSDPLGDTDLVKLLGLDGKALPQLIAVGLQEIQSTTVSIVADSVFDDPWTNTLTKALSDRNYVLVESIRLMGIHLVLFIRRPEIHYVSQVEKSYTRTGIGGLWGNKGGVSIRLVVSGVEICIVNCHLAAHLEQGAQRIDDVQQILESQTFSNGLGILDHDYIFWIGDLNFRLDDIPNDEVKSLVRQKKYSELHQYDQLKKFMKEEVIFLEFQEGPLEFDPTFKFDVGTDTYDTSKKQRKPGWCDRILWQVNEAAFEGATLAVTQSSYNSIMSYTNSDHKPVYSEFKVQVLKTPPEPDVVFESINNWVCYKDGEFTYSVRPEFEVSSWDWIGIFPSDYPSFRSYITYVWAPSTSTCIQGDGRMRFKATVKSSSIQDCNGTYSLCYYSSKAGCMMGFSDPFRIVLTEADVNSSSSDEDLSIGADEAFKL